MINQVASRKRVFLILGMLFLFFITDTVNAVFSHISALSYFPSGGFSSFSRGAIFAVLVMLFVFEERLSRGLFFVTLLCLIMFLSGFGILGISNAVLWVRHLTLLLFPFVIYWLLIKVPANQYMLIEHFFSVYIVIQVLIVLASTFFGWQLFQSYNQHRFGYSGLIFAVNEASFFYVLSGVFAYSKWQNNRKILYLILLIFIIVASLLLGSKVVYLFIFAIVIYHLYVNRVLSDKPWFFFLLLLLLLSLFFLIIYYTGLLWFFLNTKEQYGLLGMIFSLRNELFWDRVPALLSNWRWYNYLFGGMNPGVSLVEMDVIDLFLFSGVVGSVCYYYFLFKTLFNFHSSNTIAWLLVFLYFLIGGLAGHVFTSGIIGTYLAVLCVHFKNVDLLRSNAL